MADTPDQSHQDHCLAAAPQWPADSNAITFGHQLAALVANATPQAITRGAYLVREGDAAHSLFVVLSGRFAIEAAQGERRITEIAAGETIGEIGFLSNGRRTASARAIRDSVVVEIDRTSFEKAAHDDPEIWRSITAKLADRLAAQTRLTLDVSSRAIDLTTAPPRPRTIALISATRDAIPPAVLSALIDTAPHAATTCFLSSRTLHEYLPNFAPGELTSTAALNKLEEQFATVVFIADDTLTDWTKCILRQADEVVAIADCTNGLADQFKRTPVERLAEDLHAPQSMRLVLLHDHERPVVGSTAQWLNGRKALHHHHVALDAIESFKRLWRFLTGTAMGYVACGGGSFSAAHIGIYEACRRRNIALDMFVGTSGGAAMAAAFAQNASPDKISDGVARMFVKGRTFSRYTLPVYGLLDHTYFDDQLRAAYGDADIEDLWLPYTAVATDLGETRIALLRRGPLWQAIRASAAIPGLFPPYYTQDGRMLVDGSVIANVPLQAMQSLKRGPNLVTNFRDVSAQRNDVDYSALPGRGGMLAHLFFDRRKSKVTAPSAANVLVRSLMADRDHFERYLTSQDRLLTPPIAQTLSALDWRTHRQVRTEALAYALAALS